MPFYCYLCSRLYVYLMGGADFCCGNRCYNEIYTLNEYTNPNRYSV